jgi:glycosyltransferase involved in cell wall biosynthesis
MRRILHVIDSFEDACRGHQLRVLAEGLSREEFEQQIAVLDASKIPLPFREGLGEDSKELPSSCITTLNRRPAIDPLAFFRLRRLIHRFQPDIVHTWNVDAALYGTAAINGAKKRPTVVVGLNRIDPWKPAWRWSVLRRWVSPAARIVTNSASVRDWYVGKGFDANHFRLIPPGIPSARQSDVSREGLLRELQLPADAKLIGVIARLVPENRVKDLIWAADLLRVLHDNLRVLVIGDGPLRVELEEYARLASDLDHIRFLGERSDAWRILPHLNVLWNGSENIGPSPAILEAMAAGVPIIASDTPTNRELMVEVETAYLIPLGNRAGRAARARLTDRIFVDAELANRLSHAAQKRTAEQFCVQNYLKSYTELYSQTG